MFEIAHQTIFKTLTGSRVYGTYTDESDYDHRGVLIPPEDYYFSFYKNFEQYESGTEDTVIYGIHKFVKLAAANNPNVIELLYIPEKFWTHSSDYWKRLVDIRDLFLSKNCFRTYRGYAAGQMRKINKVDKTNEKRSALIEKIGYDCKDGMHLYRLLVSCKEILTENTIKVERPDVAFLREIRSGNVPYEDLMSIVGEQEKELTRLFESTKLRDEADYEKIDKVMMEVIKDFLHIGSGGQR